MSALNRRARDWWRTYWPELALVVVMAAIMLGIGLAARDSLPPEASPVRSER